MQARVSRPGSTLARGVPYQLLGASLCVLLGLAMIVNTQLGGEAMWFWYATVFHGGARLYADLHTPLQPLFVLLTDGWMRLFGVKAMVTEIPSLLQVIVMCVGLYLALRESDWPDWQKGIVLAGAFVLTVVGSSYRFDDYHVLAENLILYSFVLLLWIARAETARRLGSLAAGLGVLAGCTITSRLTDGAALLVAVTACLLLLSRRRKLLTTGLFVLVAVLTVVLIVSLTGDTFADYLNSTVFKAASSKGGTGSILAAPLLFFRNALLLMTRAGKGMTLWVAVLIAFGAGLQRYGRRGVSAIVAAQLGFAAVSFVAAPHATKDQVLTGALINVMTLVLTVLTYVLAGVVAIRFGLWAMGRTSHRFDPREVVILLPLAEWASYSAGAGAEPHTGYYAPVALLLLMVPVLQPFGRERAWAQASFVTLLAILGLSGILSKVHTPYFWQNYGSAPMFTHRVWYRHPVYGPLYIDRDLLAFSTAVCTDIHGGHELLSLPYPYPNWFCATPPWHGYVQTFFDTSTRATIQHLIAELEAAPPQWIVYQRQLHILSGAETLYNHGKPLAQRDLDRSIMDRLRSGQWTLVDKKNYLEGDGWFIIRTRP